jgi:hypothetical protein
MRTSDFVPTAVSPALRAIAAKLLWWKSPDQALEDPIRLACQVMTLGTWQDVLVARAELGDDLFREALRKAPPGVFDARSWNYWHLVYEMTPVPPLPVRTFPE